MYFYAIFRKFSVCPSENQLVLLHTKVLSLMGLDYMEEDVDKVFIENLNTILPL